MEKSVKFKGGGGTVCIAVVMATYKSEKYILEQLKSLYSQTRRIDKLIIADDSCDPQDAGLKIIREFIKTHDLKNWSVTVNPENKGHAANFIDLCRNVDADYIFFCDQDDIWASDKIECMVAAMESDPKIQMLCAAVINFPDGDENSLTQKLIPGSGKIWQVPFSPDRYFFKGLGCASCVRGNFVKSVLLYWVPGWEHDMFFWACAILQDGAYMYDYPVVYRRLHDSNASITGKKTRAQRLKQVKCSLARPREAMKLLGQAASPISNLGAKVKFLKKYQKCLQLRNKMLHGHNLFIGLWLFTVYRNCYLHKSKGVFLDMYLSVFSRT